MNPILTFDAAFYLEQNEDVAAAVAAGQFPDAFAHFQQFGQFELRDPNAQFDTSFYLSQNADVIRGLTAGTINSAFEQFVLNGQFEGEGRAPSATLAEFDEAAYIAANPDVREAVEAGTFPNGFAHFLQFGFGENRPATPNFQPGQDALSQALVALQDAQDAITDFFDGRTETNEVELEQTVANAEADLASARTTVGTDSQLAAAVVTEQADLAAATAAVNASAGLRAIVNRIDAAETAVETTEAAQTVALGNQVGTEARLETTLGGAITIDSASGETVFTSSAPGATPVTLLEENADGDLAVVTGLSGAQLAAANQLLTVVQARLDADEANAAADIELTAANAALTARPGPDQTLVTNEVDAEADLAAAELAVTTREGLIADVQTAENALEEFQGLQATLEAAQQDVADLGVDNVELLDQASETATDGADLFVLGGANSEITGFDADEDSIFVGTNFTAVPLTAEQLEAAQDAGFVGDASVREVFVFQDGANTVLQFENQSFSGNLPVAGDFQTITLTGVDAESVAIDVNGFLRVTEADALVA